MDIIGIKRIATALMLGVTVVSAGAQESETNAASALLTKLTGFYRSLEAVSVESELVVSMGEPGKERVIQSLKQTVRLNRPGQYSISTRGVGDFLSMPSVYLDGGKATILIDETRAIQTEDIATVPALFQSPKLGYNEGASGNVILDQNLALSFLNKLLFSELGQGWEKDLKEVKLVGEEKLGGHEAQVLVLSTETQQFGKPAKMDLKIWVQKGEQPFLLALEPDMSQLFPREEGQPAMNLEMMSLWSDWNGAPEFSKRDFAVPDVGEQLKTHESVEAMLHAQTAETNPALTLTGEVAPDFEFPMLAGGQTKLSELKGNVVVVGFWAAMLGAESNYLGVLHRVHEKLQARGVRLLAVNLGDPAETASAYLEKGKWKLPVALDAKQASMTSYKVRSIPQTVVIGKDGDIIQVHVGTDEAFEGELIDELSRLVDDKGTAPATLE